MLELKGVYAGYGGGDVLRDISCSFPRGSLWCVLGPNGCGKTTLLRAMAGLIPHRGEVLLDGRDVRSWRRRELAAKIAIMSQINTLYFPYTVYDTLMLGRYHHMKGGLTGGASRRDKEAVERCLTATGLWDMRGRMVNGLSGGQRQRVFLAQVLAQEPEIILLNEPTNHLDVKHQVELIDHLHAWCAEGGHTVIGVFHDVNLALRLSKKAVFMRDGQVLKQGDFTGIADGPFLEALYGLDIAGYMRDSLRTWEAVSPHPVPSEGQ